MIKLSSIEELKDIFKMVRSDVNYSRPQIVICGETGCQASGANDIIRVAKKYILQNQLVGKIEFRITGCHGFCEMGPTAITKPPSEGLL